MKNTILIIICLGIYIAGSSAQARYQVGDSLFVWAKSGLNLRIKPSIDAPKLTVIPYGNTIEVIDTAIQTLSHSIVIAKPKEKDGFRLKGFWVMVKYGEKVGFAFDGYLSKLPVVDISKDKKETEFNGFYHYAVRLWGKPLKERRWQTHSGEKNHFDMIFKNGTTYHGYEGMKGGKYIFRIPTLHLTEAYLLGNAIHDIESYVGCYQEAIVERRGGVIEFGCELLSGKIYIEQGNAVVEFEHSE
ncbi:MAG: SH3 domain-containing protein [Lewinellaceae bacterium]|nr:SH3 domain-containing protein [Lewinellaceae bacterium]